MQYSPIHPLDVQQVQTLLHNCRFSFSCHYAPFPLAFPLFLILQRASLLFKHLWCRRGAGKWAREWAMIRKGWKSDFIYKERGRSISQHCPYVSFFKLEWVAGRQQMNSCSPLEDNKVCPDMQKKVVHTVFWELQYIVQKWRVPIEGAEPGE